MASYMSGASAVVAEAGAAIAFYTQIENGMYKLSPYGEVCKNFNAFTQAYSDVGITYTPIAIALDYYHGMDRQPSGSKAFGKFAYNSGDMMSHNLIDMIWPVPGRWKAGATKPVLLPTAPMETALISCCRRFAGGSQ